MSAITLSHPKHHLKSYLNVYTCLDFRGSRRAWTDLGPGTSKSAPDRTRGPTFKTVGPDRPAHSILKRPGPHEIL